MSLRDEVIDKIRKYITAFKQFNMDVDYQPREILEMIERTGYMHKDDIAKGWVVKDKPYTDIGPSFTDKERNEDAHRQVDENEKRRNTPATIQEVLDGKAVKDDQTYL